MCTQSLSCVACFANPWTELHQILCPRGFSRQEYWSELPCLPPGGLPNPGIKPRSPTLQVDPLLSEPSRKSVSPNKQNLSIRQFNTFLWVVFFIILKVSVPSTYISFLFLLLFKCILILDQIYLFYSTKKLLMIIGQISFLFLISFLLLYLLIPSLWGWCLFDILCLSS